MALRPAVRGGGDGGRHGPDRDHGADQLRDRGRVAIRADRADFRRRAGHRGDPGGAGGESAAGDVFRVARALLHRDVELGAGDRGLFRGRPGLRAGAAALPGPPGGKPGPSHRLLFRVRRPDPAELDRGHGRGRAGGLGDSGEPAERLRAAADLLRAGRADDPGRAESLRGGGGGDGGNGGTGGYGGAGGGGPSFGVVFSGGMAPNLSNNDITSAMGGNGGSGGLRGNGGEGGYSYALFDRDTSDAFFAVLDQNTLSFGVSGGGGSSSGLDTAVSGADGMAGETNWTP